MSDIRDVLSLAMSGEGRLVAAAVLFALVWALKNVPAVGPWLRSDSSGWLTAKRKKLLANVVLSLAPTAVMLTGDAPLRDVVVTGLTAAFLASGYQGKLRAVRARSGRA